MVRDFMVMFSISKEEEAKEIGKAKNKAKIG